MNPPLRTEEDREAIIQGIVDSTITALATDHAPHTQSEKAKGFLHGPFGVVGLETAVAITYGALVESGRLPVMDWLARWTLGPARVLGLPLPSLADGAVADVTLLDVTSEWVVKAAAFAGKSTNTPFEGRKVRGRAVQTFLAGRRTWQS